MVNIADMDSSNDKDPIFSEATLIDDTVFFSSKDEENILGGFG